MSRERKTDIVKEKKQEKKRKNPWMKCIKKKQQQNKQILDARVTESDKINIHK